MFFVAGSKSHGPLIETRYLWRPMSRRSQSQRCGIIILASGSALLISILRQDGAVGESSVDAEAARIDAWLASQKKVLNKYGDPIDTMYAGVKLALHACIVKRRGTVTSLPRNNSHNFAGATLQARRHCLTRSRAKRCSSMTT